MAKALTNKKNVTRHHQKKELKIAIHHLSKDPVLRKIIKRVGECTLKPRRAYFFILCDSIISQQLNTKVSTIILERFRNHCAQLHKRYPTPEDVLACSDQELRKLGLSHQKITYLKDLAKHFHEKIILPQKFHNFTDEQIIEELVTVKGIGRWTAEMFLIFSLCRLNVWPADDFGIRKAIQQNYKMKKMPTPKQLRAFVAKKNWTPYCTIASWYLWRSLTLN